MSATPCHLYYDLEVANQSLSDTSTPPSELTFTEVRASAVLSNPNEYFMSIVRFSVDTAGSLPVFLSQIDLAQPTGGANFPNLTVYNISFNYTNPAVPALAAPGINFTAPIIYVPHSTQVGISSAPQFKVPTAPLTIDKATNNYYWVQCLKRIVGGSMEDGYKDLSGMGLAGSGLAGSGASGAGQAGSGQACSGLAGSGKPPRISKHIQG